MRVYVDPACPLLQGISPPRGWYLLQLYCIDYIFKKMKYHSTLEL